MNRAKYFRDQHPELGVFKRTPNSVHLLTGNVNPVTGANEAIAYFSASNDMHLPDGTEIDTAWQATGDEEGGWDYEMTLAAYQAYARSVFNVGNLIQFEYGGEYVLFDPQSINWLDVNNSRSQIAIKQNVTATVSDDVLTWTAAYGAGLHVRYQCIPELLAKEVVIDSLASLPTPPGYMVGPIQFEAEFTLSHSTGVEIYLDGALWTKQNNVRVATASAIEFRSVATGDPMFSMPAPIASDSSNDQVVGSFEVRNQSGTYFVTVRIPYSWLQTAVFPVAVDPSTALRPDESSSNDTYITTLAPTVNYGSNAYLWAGRSSGYDYRTLIDFDLSSLDASYSCSACTLGIYRTSSTGPAPMYVSLRPWTESGATWNTYDGTNSWDSGGASTSGVDYEADASPPAVGASGMGAGTYDITTGANLTASKIGSFFGSTLRLTWGQGETTNIAGAMQSNNATVENRPVLTITFTVPLQYMRPDSDISNAGGWVPSTGSDLYAVIDETSPSSSDIIASGANPSNAVCIVGTSSPTATPGSDSYHTVSYQYYKLESGTGRQIAITVTLKQGTTTIASWTHTNVSTTPTRADQELTTEQAATITDYSDLRLEFSANVT